MPASTAAAPQAGGGTFEGRTFSQWAESFKWELDISLRKRALGAFRIFADNGHGKEVAELVIASLGPMMPDIGIIAEDEKALNDDDREALEAQDEELMVLLGLSASTLRRVPREELLPVISKVLEGESNPDRRFVLFAIEDPELLPVYLRLMRDGDRTIAWIAMLRASETAPGEVGRMLDKSLATSERDERLWAIKTLAGVVKTQPFQDHLCKRLARLFGDDDQEVSNAAFRAALKIGVKMRPALEEAMKSAEGWAALQIYEMLREMPQQTTVVEQPNNEVATGHQHYDGKTFDQWRTQLKTDLSPTLRREAINAIGEFALHGYGQEAAAALCDPDREIVELARAPLAIIDHDNSDLDASIRRGLESDNPNEVHNAVWVARGCPIVVPGREAMVSRPYPELLPATLSLLDHSDSDIRKRAIEALSGSVVGPSQAEYVEALEKIASSGTIAGEHAREILDRLKPAIDLPR